MNIISLAGLQEKDYAASGGKARGLAELARAGLTIAPGFVVIGLETGADGLFEQAADYYEKSSLGCVAVRSSAAAEDGADFSSAGQYSSFLNVQGRLAFVEALKNCTASLHNREAEAYSGFFSQARSVSMSVVVQKMVDAACAGVCFTRDPLASVEDAAGADAPGTMVIEAVRGLGESLVSGQARPERVTVSADGEPVTVPGNVLSAEQANMIASGAIRARRFFNMELDLEWAVDKAGKLYWLQARPITTLDEAGVGELDSRVGDEHTVFTTCNIGEMLPGAVTPLSLSTSVDAIEYGLRWMLVKVGAYKNLDEIGAGQVVCRFSNHLFFNLNAIYKMASAMIGANKEAVESSICGKVLKDTPPNPWPQAPMIVKLVNGIKYGSFIMGTKKALAAADRESAAMKVDDAPTPAAYYKNICKALDDCRRVTCYHYVSSAHSGAMSSAVIQMLQGSGYSEEAARARLSEFLVDIDNIESVDILRSMRRLAHETLRAYPQSKAFSLEELAACIKNDSGAVRQAYDAFISRHGHRSIREAELRNRSWKNDEAALMENVRTVMMSGALEMPVDQAAKKKAFEARLAAFLETLPKNKRKGLEFVLKQSR